MSVIQTNISLKSYNTFAIAINAKFFAEVKNETALKEVFATEVARNEKLLVLGGGSNMLFTNDYGGLVLKISIKGCLLYTSRCV